MRIMDTLDQPARMPRRPLIWGLALLTLVMLPACATRTVQQTSDPIQGSSFQMEQIKAMNLMVEGRLADAEAGFLKAEKAANNDAERALARTGLGGVELKRHNYAGADKLLEDALRKEPKTTDAWIFLAESKIAQGDTMTAISALKEGRLRTEGNPELDAYLGLLYLDWGAPVQAVMHLERALEREPNRKVWWDALRQAQEEAGLLQTEEELAAMAGGDSTRAATDSAEVMTLMEGDELITPGAAGAPTAIAAGAVAVAGAKTVEPSNELLARYQRRADVLVQASQLSRIDLAVLLAMHGPVISPWPGLGDLPVDVREHEYAEAAGVALFAGWMQRLPDGLFYPDDPLNRAQTALLIYPQINRYPALAKSARLNRSEPLDLPPEHYAYLEISTVVASGLMELDASGNFRADAPLSGAAGDHMARLLARALEEGLSGYREDTESTAPDPGAP
jgi:tetratricopeptide (TPR) repeat protein